MAAANRIDVNPEPAQSANAETSAVAAEIAAGASPVAAVHSVASTAKAAASMWVAAPVISADTAQQGITVDAALAARGVNIANRDFQAVSATMVTDEDNGRALTPHPEVSI